MNKILIGVNAVLILAVAFLFYKLNSISVKEEVVKPENTEVKEPEVKAPKAVEQVGNVPTGKIAYVNIDKLNEQSVEISDLVNESKRRKSGIEASMENLNQQYQKKVEEYQVSAKAGIAPASEMKAKENEIIALEKEAQNKQLQMDNLSLDINEKNINFQKTVKDFLIKWNQGRYDFILSYSDAVPSMLLGNTTLEVTDDVIKELNAEYKQRKSKK